MPTKITVQQGDTGLLKPLITAIWDFIMPPFGGEIISYAAQQQGDANTLLLFTSRELEVGTLIANPESLEVSRNVANFVKQWIDKEDDPTMPAPAHGGSYFKGFCLSNEHIQPYKGVRPFLQIRLTWVFYDQ